MVMAAARSEVRAHNRESHVRQGNRDVAITADTARTTKTGPVTAPTGTAV